MSEIVYAKHSIYKISRNNSCFIHFDSILSELIQHHLKESYQQLVKEIHSIHDVISYMLNRKENDKHF